MAPRYRPGPESPIRGDFTFRSSSGRADNRDGRESGSGDMARRQPTGDEHDAARRSAAVGRRRASMSVADRTELLDLLPHPAFVVVVDGDDAFHFVYVNDAYRCAARRRRRAATCVPRYPPTRSCRTSARSRAQRATPRPSRSRPIGAGRGSPPHRRRRHADRRRRRRVPRAHRRRVRGHRTPPASKPQLAHRTRHDPLTELPNRVMLVEWLEDALRALQAPTAMVGLVLLDVDHFKIVNDSLGHGAGDELLAAAGPARRTACCGPATSSRGSAATSSRSCATTPRRPDDALTLARRVLSVFDEPFTLEGDDEVFLGASVGVAVSTGPRRHARSADPRRRRRDVRRQGARPRPRRGVRRLDARARGTPARASKPPCGAAIVARRVPRALPAGRRLRLARRSSASKRSCAGSTPSGA